MRQSKRLLILCLVAVVFVTFVSGLWAQEVKKVNINTATVEEIAQLQKIGPKYAERIVKYRQENGPFQKPEDITKVKGIGQKTLELNKDRITVD